MRRASRRRCGSTRSTISIVPKEHADIVMGHGTHDRNNNCFNCHDEQNLELLQTRDGRAGQAGGQPAAVRQLPRPDLSRLGSRRPRPHQRLLGPEPRPDEAQDLRGLPQSALAQVPGRANPRPARICCTRWPATAPQQRVALICRTRPPAPPSNPPSADGHEPPEFSAHLGGVGLRPGGLGREPGAAARSERFPDRRAVPAEVLQGADAGGDGQGPEAHRGRGGAAIRHCARTCATSSRWTAWSSSMR